MHDALVPYLEENFSFDPFKELSLTRAAITESPGTIKYIPTRYPLPLSKRALTAIIDVDSSPVRALPMPTTEQELEKTIRSSLNYLLDYDGDATAVFFCPSYLEPEIDATPGSQFVSTDELTLQDKFLTLRGVFKELSGVTLTGQFSTLSEFILTSYLSATIGEYVDPANLAVCTKPRWDFYIEYNALVEDDPLSDFYLQSLSVDNTTQFWNLPVHARENVYEVLFQATYDQPAIDDRARFLDTWTTLSNSAKQTLRTLTSTEAIKGRFFSSKLSELAPEWNRPLAEELQDNYPDLVGDDAASLSVNNPEDAAQELRDYFGIIWANASADEIHDAITHARNRFAEDAQHIVEYRPSRAEDTLSRIDRILQLLLEVETVTDEEVVAAAFADADADWQSVFEDILRTMVEKNLSGHLTTNHIKPLSDARRRIEREQANEADAEELLAQPVSLSTLTDFLEEWIGFVIAEYEGDSSRTTVYRDALLDKYEEYCDTLVDEYQSIKASDDHEHISELLFPQSEPLRVFLVIDSLGYTDVEFMHQWGLLDSSPDVEPVFSNIPSYTPSAMSTILSGLSAIESGIYHWTAKHGDELYNLKWEYDPDDFEWVDASTELSYELIQEDSLNKSGVTRFAQAVADISLAGEFASCEKLEDLQAEITNTVNKKLAERHKNYTDDEIKEEHRQRRLESQKSDFVVYIKEFDDYLHKDLSTFEFRNYYSTLAAFIDAVSAEILDSLDDYAVGDEPTEFVICSDHGKITRQEQQLFTQARSLEQFRQSDLGNRIDGILQTQYELRLDKAPFTNLDGKYPLGVGDIDEEILIQRASDIIDRTPSDETEADSTEMAEEELKAVIEEKPAMISASKFLFGWTEEGSTQPRHSKRIGIDVYQPEAEGEFDSPSVGLVSRYQTKNTGRAHGYHGGTSISEMIAAKLTFRGNENA